MDLSALFQITHGVYITGARDGNNRLIGSCIDSVMVVEADPAQVIISLGKKSYTGKTVLKTRRLSLSVLPADASDELIERFGTQTSETVDKWQDTPYTLQNDLPVVQNAVASYVLKVNHSFDTATHHVFVCDVETINRGSMAKPLIYADYQDRKSDKNTGKWVCTVCGYVYDNDTPFEYLPDDWLCPLCGEPKSVFIQK